MRRSTFALLMTLSLAGASTTLHAQQSAPQGPPQPPRAGPGEIRGTVVGAEDGAALASASVAVWREDGSALVAGAIAERNGTFRIQGLPPGGYVLRVTMLGYAMRSSDPVRVSAEAPLANVGTVTLARQALQLEGIVVAAEQEMTVAPDRNAYRVRDVAPAAGSASEVLENVPSLQVDADGKVSLRGNENVVVQINGRPVPVGGDQLATYLRTLPANTIERVEVIPNPSARNDPDGMAGIVNIVMRQGVDLGTSGTLSLSGSTNDRYSASGTLGHQSGPLTLLLTYGYVTQDQRTVGINDRTRLGAGAVPLSYTEQALAGDEGFRGHNATASLDYRLNERDVLSSVMQIGRRSASDLSTVAFTERDAAGEVTDTYGRVRDAEERGSTDDLLLAAKRTYAPRTHELSAEARYTRTGEDDHTSAWRNALTPGGRIDAENDRLDAGTTQWSAQADYTRMVAGQTRLETGYRGVFRRLDRDYGLERDPLGTGEFDPSELSNELALDEDVHAAYAVLSGTRGRFELQGGLRAEHAQRDFVLAGEDESYPFTYRSLFPSGIASYQLDEGSTLRLSYSRRIRRPGTGELNPFPRYFDLNNVFFGNPSLSPEYTDAFELTYQRSGAVGTFQLSPFFRRTTDVIRVAINTADTLNGREITSLSFQNLDRSTSWGADVNGQFRIGPAFRGMASFNLFKMVTDGGSASALASDGVNWSVRLNGTLTVDPKTTLQGNYFYRAPMEIERGRFHAFSMLNLSARRQLRDDRAVLTVRVSDPFATGRFGARVGDEHLIQLTERSFQSRALHVGLQLSHGRAPRVRQRPQEEQSEPSTPFGG
jgi:ferric enterobactin receptor